MKKSNIFLDIPTNVGEEIFQDIISKDNIKIERIISRGHKTKEDEWYNQDFDEWVMVVKGEATLSYVDAEDVRLGEGDYINIPAHTKHRVSWTKEDVETIWLAVHY